MRRVCVLFEEVEVLICCDVSSVENLILHELYIDLPNKKLLAFDPLSLRPEEHGQYFFYHSIFTGLFGFNCGEDLEIGFDDDRTVELSIYLLLPCAFKSKVL